jgi:hypothetical protein
MAKSSKKRCEELPILHPDAAGIDVHADRDHQPVRSFSTSTRDLNALADWLQHCGGSLSSNGVIQRVLDWCIKSWSPAGSKCVSSMRNGTGTPARHSASGRITGCGKRGDRRGSWRLFSSDLAERRRWLPECCAEQLVQRTRWRLELRRLTDPANLYRGDRLRSELRLAEARQQTAVLFYQQSIQGAFRSVSDALVAYHKNREFRARQELLFQSAQDAARLSHMRYTGGVTGYLEVLTNETNAFSAELGLVQARLNELLALVQLYEALGGDWQQ